MQNIQGTKIECLRIELKPLDEETGVPSELLEFSNSDSPSGFHYMILKRKMNEIVGVISIDKFKEMRDSYNVSYMILSEHRGNNYTKEALVFLLENIYGKGSFIKAKSGKPFRPSNLVVVSSIHNAASKRIATDLGFTFASRIKIGGKSHNIYVLSRDSYYENQLDYTFMKFEFMEHRQFD